MDKIVIVCALIFIGLFIVFVINSNSSTPAAEQATITPTQTPISSPTQVLSITSSPSQSSLQSETKTTAIIKTSKGDIYLMFYPTDAPNTVANFAAKAKSGSYDNLIFHRVEDWVIQGGDPDGNGTGGGNMPVEFNNKPFVVGSLGVASRGDGKVQNDAQFFITKTEASWLNGQYTNFGIVTKGIDIVERIQINDKILEINIFP